MGLDFSKEGELMAVQKKLMMTEKAMMMEKQMMMFKQKQMMMNKQKAMMMRRQQEKMLKKRSQKQPEITRLQHQARISTQKSFNLFNIHTTITHINYLYKCIYARQNKAKKCFTFIYLFCRGYLVTPPLLVSARSNSGRLCLHYSTLFLVITVFMAFIIIVIIIIITIIVVVVFIIIVMIRIVV